MSKLYLKLILKILDLDELLDLAQYERRNVVLYLEHGAGSVAALLLFHFFQSRHRKFLQRENVNKLVVVAPNIGTADDDEIDDLKFSESFEKLIFFISFPTPSQSPRAHNAIVATSTSSSFLHRYI